VLAVGYLGDPDLTAARFVVDAGGVRWYRTGDRAETTGDGGYRFLGRADGQVKVSGYRVEPAEVEVVLASLPEIESAAVVVQRSASGSAPASGSRSIRATTCGRSARTR
jgi:pyochelin synthetase